MAKRSAATTVTTTDVFDQRVESDDNHHETRPDDDAGPVVVTDGSATTTAATSPPKPRRRPRGPNKSKPGTIVVHTEASMSKEEIVKLLTAHVTGMLGAEAAAAMELQFMEGSQWSSLDVVGDLRFATKGHK